MKRCPYCAEEIQDEASICRYCRKKVRGRHIKYIVIFILAIAVVFFAISHKSQTQGVIDNIKQFGQNWNDMWQTIREIISNIYEAVKNLKDYNQKIDSINRV